MVNKTSPGGRGAKKNKKGINIFSKKGFLRGGTNVAKGGDQKIFFARLRAQIVPPLNKSPRTPLTSYINPIASFYSYAGQRWVLQL